MAVLGGDETYGGIFVLNSGTPIHKGKTVSFNHIARKARRAINLMSFTGSRLRLFRFRLLLRDKEADLLSLIDRRSDNLKLSASRPIGARRNRATSILRKQTVSHMER